MKKRIFKYIPIALVAIMMASCADDDEENPLNDNPTVPKPTIEVSVNGETNQSTYEVLQNDTVEIYMTALAAAGGGANLDVVSLSQTGNNATNSNFTLTASESGDPYDFSTGSEQNIKNADNERLTLSGSFSNITGNVGNTTYEFTVKDKDGLIATNSFTIEVVTSTPFASTNTGEIWHIRGLKRGSWSLTADSAISAINSQNENEADIINTDAAGVTFTGSFKVGDNRANTTFVKASSAFDYTNATQEDAMTAFNAGTATSVTASAPAVGDVFIYQLGGGNYTVVKITSIDPTASCGAGCNNPGKMDFEYKK